MMRHLSDGSIETTDGSVVLLSRERFIADVCEGNNCFVCAQPLESSSTSQEHVIPAWVLRMFGLHQKLLNLPNRTPLRYDQYLVPCCTACNGAMGATFETPIGELVAEGHNAIADYLLREGPWKIFMWLALIFVKAHLKDRTLRMSRDLRSTPGSIAASYDWESFYRTYCIARCFRFGSHIETTAIGSLFVLPAAPAAGNEFDYVDLYQSRSILLRLGDTCMVAVLDDSCAAFSLLKHLLPRISAPLTPPQAREFLAQAAFTNMVLDPRPQFVTEVSDDRLILRADLPEKIAFRQYDTSEFQALIHLCLGDILVDSAGKKVDLGTVLRGGRSLLFDGDTFLAGAPRRASEAG